MVELRGRDMHFVTRVACVAATVGVLVSACAKKNPPVATQPPPPATTSTPPPATAAAVPPAERVEEPVPVTGLNEDAIGNRTLEDLNRDSPFMPAFFGLDSAELDDVGRAVVTANAQIMKKYPTWVITVEGHCDERGTAEYNLALG